MEKSNAEDMQDNKPVVVINKRNTGSIFKEI